MNACSHRQPTLLIAALFLALAARLCAQVSQGMHEGDLLTLKGTPTSKVAAGPRVIYGWPDMQVTVVNGVVAKVALSNAAAGAAEDDRRARLAADAQKAQAEKGAPVTNQKLRAREEFVRSEAGKQLWARSCMGQPAPPLFVENWLTDKPPPSDGKFRLIDFWATWCRPCREAIAELNEIHRQLGDRVDVIGVSDEPESAVRRMREPAIDYFVCIDTQARTKKALEVTGIPHVILIDPSGVVRWEGFPLLEGHRLSVQVVQRVIDLYSM